MFLSPPASRSEYREPINPIRWLLFGYPTPSSKHEHTLLPKILALSVFGADPISSAVYATQEILLALSIAGVGALIYTVHISMAIALLMVIVAFSYRQTLYAYPGGGGSYIVAKDNLGTRWGLVAAAALLIDYILTVAVSIASGVQNLMAMPFMLTYKDDAVLVCVGAAAFLTLANLRGLKESGMMFAVPTYAFVFSCLAMIAVGLFGPALVGWHLNPTPPAPGPLAATQSFGLALALAAFSRGCAALTGTEAVSNGVTALTEPRSRNGAVTLAWMAAILGALFLGISALAVRTGVVYVNGSEPVIDQLNGIVFGKGTWFYYLLQGSTVAILLLAANTAFADFPRLAAILARDSFVPHQLSNLGDKLTFSNGIVLLGLISASLIMLFKGNTDSLIPLYAIGVFLAFTLSQGGMVVHWIRSHEPNWIGKAVVNGIGAVTTFLVLCTIGYEKVVADVLFNGGREFGWVIAVLIVLAYGGFRVVEGHYKSLAQRTSLDGYVPRRPDHPNTVLVLVPRLHRGVMEALDYCRGISKDVRALHIGIEDTSTLEKDWERLVPDLPLVVIDSPYRSIVGPLLEYLNEVDDERPDAYITVVVPEAVTNKWWHRLLHAHYGAWIKLYLMNRPNIIVTNIRYFPAVRRGANAGATARAGRGAEPESRDARAS